MNDLNSIYWLIDCLHSIDVGVVAIDRDYKVQLWNRFMENHSGKKQDKVLSKSLFEQFPDLPEEWVRRKADSVFSMKNRTYSTWEQRDYLFQFENHMPITGWSKYMYQNIAFVPFMSADMEVRQVGIIVYDVTDIAVGRIELEHANAQLRHLSRTDRLTGLNNRGFWEECLVSEFQRTMRYGKPSSLIMFDIDHFKKVNDTYGHDCGDEALIQFSKQLNDMFPNDLTARLGGEEFVILFKGTELETVKQALENFRLTIAETPINCEEQSLSITVSMGVHNQYEEHLDGMLKVADSNLYQSKQNGRNRITL